MQDPALRRRVAVGLNTGGAGNAPASLCSSIGEVRDRSFENQQYRASGLNLAIAKLVVAAITLWNTVYLERAVTLGGKSQDTALLQHVSPLGGEHVGLYIPFLEQGGRIAGARRSQRRA